MSRKGEPRPQGRAVSDAEFRRMWEDMTLSQAEIGRRLGISGEAVRFRAAVRGLPARPKLRPFTRQHDHDRIVRLYQSGLAMEVVGRLVGCTVSVVRLALRNAGVAARSRNDPKNSVSAAKLPAWLLGRAARKEQAALRLAEMVDKLNPPQPGAGRAERRAA